MQSVTSNAVAEAIGEWVNLWAPDAYNYIKGKKDKTGVYVVIHLQMLSCSTNEHLITTLPTDYRPTNISRGFCFAYDYPLNMGFINIESTGEVIVRNMGGLTVFGDSFIKIEN